MDSTPPLGLLDEINSLFSWNLPKLYNTDETNLSTSTVTHSPFAFYPKHFSPALVVKKVERYPSLIQDLARNVDKALKAASKNLPPLKGFVTAEQRAEEEQDLNKVMAYEGAVADFYGLTTPRYCLRVASTLALHPSFPAWRTLLHWTSYSDCGITTGQLCFLIGVDQCKKEHEAIVKTMDSKSRVIYEKVRDSMSPLATWQMESMSTGTPKVMNAVLNLGEFPWTFCTAKDRDTLRKHDNARKQVKPAIVGPDAQDPPWSLPVTKDKGKKRKRDDDVYRDGHDITAQYLVQKAWAQAVRVDGTIIVIHSSNQEIVCLRHRASQTLYVSDVIEPSTCSDPGYGKLHVGIYIAAIQDVMDRGLQQLSESKPPGDLINGSQDQDDEDYTRGGFQSPTGRKGFTEAIEKAIDVASNRNVILLYLHYDVYDSPVPASFLRSAPSILTYTRCPTPLFSPRSLHSYELEACLNIVLTSEIGWGATGVIHRGTLKPELLDGVMPLDVIVKLAFDDEQRDALRSEYEVYHRLKSKGVDKGIATALGVFDDSESCACALVLLYAGVPLSESQGNLSTSDCESALQSLKSIHDAGILHGDICRENILVGDEGVTIIDFELSKQCDDQRPKDLEMAWLRRCLLLEGKD